MSGNSIEILECAGCRRHVVAIVDSDGIGQRINHHKCNGQWTTVEAIPLTPAEWASLAECATICAEGE